MKRHLVAAGLLSAFSLMGVTSKAQIQKGNTMWGGSLSDLQVGLKSGEGFDFNITPKAGYFVKDNIAIGGYVNLGFSKSGAGVATKNQYGLGAFARYYAKPGDVDNLLKHGRFFGEANAGFLGISQKSQPTTNGFNFGFGPGYSYFITPNIGLEGLIKYNGLVGGGNTTYQHYVTFNLGFQVYLPSAKVKSMAKNPASL